MRPMGMKYKTRTRTAALLAVLAIAVSACSAASANTDNTMPGSDTPVESPVTTVPSDGGVDDITYRPIEVEGGLVGPGHIINHGEIIAVDGNKMTLGFWMGTDTCYGIERIDLAESETKVAIDITIGDRAADQVCIEIAEARSVTVEFSSPLGERIVEVGGAPING